MTIEQLEPRIAPALLAPSVIKGVLLIQHDPASATNEDVTIHQVSPDTFAITDTLNQMFPNASGVKSITFIDANTHSTFEFSKDGLAAALKINFTGGSNSVLLTSGDGVSSKIKGAVTITGGAGDDAINVQGGLVVTGALNFTGGNGVDSLTPNGAFLLKKVTLKSVETITVDHGFAPVVIGSLLVENDDQLSGPVTFNLSTVATVLGKLKYCGGVVQTDNVTLNGQFLGPVNLMLLDGTNNVTTAGSFNSSVLITGGKGDDTITFDTTQISAGPPTPQYDTAHVAGTLTMKLGNGTNTVTLDSGSFFEKSVSLTTGTGTDTVNFDNFYAAKGLKLALGNGANTVVGPTGQGVTNYIGGAFKYTGGVDIDQVSLDHLFAGTLNLSLLNGANNVTGALQLLGASATITSGKDADFIDVTLAGASAKLSVNLGAGSDQFTFEGGSLASATLDGGLGSDTLTGAALLPAKTTIKRFEVH